MIVMMLMTLQVMLLMGAVACIGISFMPSRVDTFYFDGLLAVDAFAFNLGLVWVAGIFIIQIARVVTARKKVKEAFAEYCKNKLVPSEDISKRYDKLMGRSPLGTFFCLADANALDLLSSDIRMEILMFKLENSDILPPSEL